MPVTIESLTLGEFRELTKNLPDDVKIMITSETEPDGKALPVMVYPFDTSLDCEQIFLLSQNCNESVDFE